MKTTRHPAAFTLFELLVVIVLLALGASILVPALARTRPNSQAFKCLDNLRQLTAAWSMYNDDYNNSLLTCQTGNSGRVIWCTGNLDFTQDAAGLKVKFPAEKPCDFAYALKISGLKLK